MSMGRKTQKTQGRKFPLCKCNAAEGVYVTVVHLLFVSSDVWLYLVTGVHPYFRRTDLGGPRQSLPHLENWGEKLSPNPEETVGLSQQFEVGRRKAEASGIRSYFHVYPTGVAHHLEFVPSGCWNREGIYYRYQVAHGIPGRPGGWPWRLGRQGLSLTTCGIVLENPTRPWRGTGAPGTGHWVRVSHHSCLPNPGPARKQIRRACFFKTEVLRPYVPFTEPGSPACP